MWCQAAANNENANTNLPPTLAPPPYTVNVLTCNDLTKLVALLKGNGGPGKTPPQPKEYTGMAQGKDNQVHDITYCHSNGWTRNLDHHSGNFSRPLDGHKKESTLDNKMGGIDVQIKYSRSKPKE